MSLVLITGASFGFGRACAEKYLDAGHQVVIAARRLDRLQELVALYPDRTHAIGLDVQDRNSVFNCLEQLPKDFQSVDILINNAGLALGLGGAHEANH